MNFWPSPNIERKELNVAELAWATLPVKTGRQEQLPREVSLMKTCVLVLDGFFGLFCGRYSSLSEANFVVSITFRQ